MPSTITDWFSTLQPLIKFNAVLFGLHLIAGLVLLFLALRRDTKLLPFEITLGASKWILSTKNLVIIASCFLLITAGFHLFYTINSNNMYSFQVSKGHNYFRWIEYAITANIMAFVIAMFVRIYDGYLLLANAAIVVGIMFTGMWFEMITGKMSLVPIAVGFAMLAVLCFILYYKFTDLKKSVEDNEVLKIPSWVNWAVIGTLAFYGIFGVVPLLKYFDVIGNEWYEYAYLGLSLVSKLFLGSLLGYGAFFQNNVVA